MTGAGTPLNVIVIGAGVVGASAAWHLAQAGVAPLLIEPELPGRATAAGAGIVDPRAGAGVPAPDSHRLALASGECYPDLIAALAADGETDTGYARCGTLIVDENAAALDAIADGLLARQAASPAMGRIERLAPDEARAAFPPLHPALGAVRIAGGARVDGRRLAASLCRAAARRGARTVRGSAVLTSGDGGVRVQVDGQEVAADAILVAAGAWSAELLAPLGVALDVAPQRGQIVHLQTAMDTATWPSVLPPGDHYLVAFEGGRVVAGATRETGSGFDDRLTAAGQAQVLNDALRVAPGVGAMSVTEWRVGFRPLAADRRPRLGAVAGVPGLFVATGLGAVGLTLGPLSGKLLAHQILGRPPSLDLSFYDPSR